MSFMFVISIAFDAAAPSLSHAASTRPRHGGTTPMAASDRSIASGVPQSLQPTSPARVTTRCSGMRERNRNEPAAGRDVAVAAVGVLRTCAEERDPLGNRNDTAHALDAPTKGVAVADVMVARKDDNGRVRVSTREF